MEFEDILKYKPALDLQGETAPLGNMRLYIYLFYMLSVVFFFNKTQSPQLYVLLSFPMVLLPPHFVCVAHSAPVCQCTYVLHVFSILLVGGIAICIVSVHKYLFALAHLSSSSLACTTAFVLRCWRWQTKAGGRGRSE